jgi:predicted O-methyltransferase YrrM
MHLPWRDVPPGLGRPPIPTSMTGAEGAALARLAAGRDVLEIGSAFGYSACVMALNQATSVTAVDPHAWLASYPAMLSNLEACGVDGVVTVIRGQSPRALDGLGPFGLVFIDGDHGFEAVTADVEAARKVLAPGGILAVHDYLEACCCPGVRHAIDALFPAGPDEMVDTMFVVTP